MRWILTPRRDDDDGFALVLVLGSMLVLAMVAMTALAYTLSSQKFARYDQDYNASTAAAQSGVEDFISRLNRDDSYGTVVDCANTAWQGPTTLPNTCAPTWGTGTTPGWLPVKPGETDRAAAWFHYSVDATNAAATGTIMVTATGRVNGTYRTIEASVGKGGSTDYVYYTDFESADPSNVQAYPPSGTNVVACGSNGYQQASYWYGGRSSENCQEIQFALGDVLDGAVYTKDAIWSNGATFSAGVESMNPDCGTITDDWRTWNNCLRRNVPSPGLPTNSTADFKGIKPKLAVLHDLFDTSAAFAANPGCHYYGSTRVIFNPTGTMTVWNKTTSNNGVPPVAMAAPGGTAPSCGDVTSLNDAGGATISVPNDMVIYVAASTAPGRQCYQGDLGGPSGRTLPIGSYSATVPTSPTAGSASYTADPNMSEAKKVCAEGNLYVEGTLKGRTTVAAAQSVIVTGDLVLAGGMSGSDMLGLVATNSVEVFHPQLASYVSRSRYPNCATYGSGQPTYQYCAGQPAAVTGWPTRYNDPTTGGTSPNPVQGLQIAGSIQTLQHSFFVQKYDFGAAAGTLLVNGSIAQRWRGIVGQSGSPSTGYLKLYKYDTRLKYSSPPYFPRWASSQWSLRYSGEINTSPTVRNSAP